LPYNVDKHVFPVQAETSDEFLSPGDRWTG